MPTILTNLILLLIGYLIGGFPSAVLLARFKGENVFKVGSSNMGAMNVARNLGYGLGILVLILDIGKGALAAYLGSLFSAEATLSAGLGVVLGHLWSPYVGFKGGKALSTTFGASLILYPLAALVILVILMLAILLAKGVARGVLLASPFYPLSVFFTNESIAATITALLIASLVVFKHFPELKNYLRASTTHRE